MKNLTLVALLLSLCVPVMAQTPVAATDAKPAISKKKAAKTVVRKTKKIVKKGKADAAAPAAVAPAVGAPAVGAPAVGAPAAVPVPK